MSGVFGGVVAGCFALASFTVALLAGLAAGNAASTILFRAVVALLIAWPLGYIAGVICRRIVAADEALTAIPPASGQPVSAKAGVTSESSLSPESSRRPEPAVAAEAGTG